MFQRVQGTTLRFRFIGIHYFDDCIRYEIYIWEVHYDVSPYFGKRLGAEVKCSPSFLADLAPRGLLFADDDDNDDSPTAPFLFDTRDGPA